MYVTVAVTYNHVSTSKDISVGEWVKRARHFQDCSTEIHDWVSEASPTLGCSIEISRDMYICGNTWPKHAHAQSQFWAVITDLWYPYYYFLLYARAALAWTKNNIKCSLRNEKFKANRASGMEEQRKERLTTRREKDRERRGTKKLQEEKKRSSETEDHEKQRMATLKILKRRDEKL